MTKKRADVSELHEVLKEQRRHTWEASERRRLSENRSNYSEEFSAVELLIEACTKATLDYLGQPPHQGETTVEMIRRASALIASHPPMLSDVAPTALLARRVAAQEQTLRDLKYFRAGFGRGTGKPKPKDMRLDSPATIVTGPVNAFQQLLNYFEAAGPSVPPSAPQIKLDYGTIYDGIKERLEAPLDAESFMGSVIDLCNAQAPHDAWAAFRSLPYEQEVRERSTVILDIIHREPPPIPLVGFYFHIEYPNRAGEKVADVLLSADDTYVPTDDDWSLRVKFEPLMGSIHSAVLASVFRLAYSQQGLRKAADYPLCLAWAVYFSRACVHRYRDVTKTESVGL